MLLDEIHSGAVHIDVGDAFYQHFHQCGNRPELSEVAAQGFEVNVGIVVASGNYADEEEIGLTQASGKLLDRAAQIPVILLINVFQAIDPKSVTVVSAIRYL